MPSAQQWVYTDVVSGESATLPSAGLPDKWAIIAGDCHGPRGLFIIAQRMINQVVPGHATYDQAVNAPYDASATLDSGYTIPAGL